MEAKELRIGNYCMINNPKYLPVATKNKTTFKVVGISMADKGYSISLNSLNVKDQIISPLYSQFLNYIEPILLTEEWFNKGGAIEYKGDLIIEAWSPGHPSQRFDICFKDGVVTMNSRYQKHSSNLLMNHIKYVHQLQNLYFALVGEELEIKDL